MLHQPQGQLRGRRDHGPLLALRRFGVGLHLRAFLSLVRGNHGTRGSPTASDWRLLQGLGLALRSQHLLLYGRLPQLSGLPQMDPDPRVHAHEGGADRRRVHAHALGTARPDLRHRAAARPGDGVHAPHDIRSRQHLPDAAGVLRGGLIPPVAD